jgi:hypothetical protein
MVESLPLEDAVLDLVSSKFFGYGSSARPKSSGNLTKMATERTPK